MRTGQGQPTHSNQMLSRSVMDTRAVQLLVAATDPLTLALLTSPRVLAAVPSSQVRVRTRASWLPRIGGDGIGGDNTPRRSLVLCCMPCRLPVISTEASHKLACRPLLMTAAAGSAPAAKYAT